MTPRDNKVINQDNGSKHEIHTKPSQILAPKGIPHEKSFMFIKAILPKESPLELISNQSTPSPYANLKYN